MKSDGDADVDMGAFETGGYFQLSITKSGSGSGLVTSSPSGIDCGETCFEFFMEGISVTLIAAADGNSIFNSWSGDCGGSGDCELLIDGSKSVTAIFDPGIPTILPLIFR